MVWLERYSEWIWIGVWIAVALVGIARTFAGAAR
jgi:hypothetical protein